MAFQTFALWDILWKSLMYHTFPGRNLIRQNDLGRKYRSPTNTEVLCEAEEELRGAREILGKCVNKVPVALNTSRSRVKLLKAKFHLTLCRESPPLICLESDNYCIWWFAEFLLRREKRKLFPIHLPQTSHDLADLWYSHRLSSVHEHCRV